MSRNNGPKKLRDIKDRFGLAGAFSGKQKNPVVPELELLRGFGVGMGDAGKK